MYYIKNMPFKPRMELVSKLSEKYGFQCFYCGVECQKMQIDHVIPVCNGGSHYINNLVLCCKNCNLVKNHRSIDEFRKIRSIQNSKFAGILNSKQVEALRNLGVELCIPEYVFWFETKGFAL